MTHNKQTLGLHSKHENLSTLGSDGTWSLINILYFMACSSFNEKDNMSN